MDRSHSIPVRRPTVGRRWPEATHLVAAGALAVVAIVVADRLLADRSLSDEWPPAVGVGYLARSAALALASAALVIGARRLATDALDRGETGPTLDPLRVGAVVAGTAPAVGTAALLLVDPEALSTLVREDGPIEWISAVLAFVAGGLYLAAAVSHQPQRARTVSATTVALVLAAGTCLLLGLEEISWFQRVLEVESPEFMLNRNGQQELNLHNLATGLTGNAYFVGGFLFCTAVPYLLGDRVLPRRLAPLQPLVPGPTVFLATAASAAIVYQMWNILWIQATFWMTLTMLATWGEDRTGRRVGWALAGVAVVVAAVYLTAGDSMVRSWDDTEVREVIIPFGLAVAAGQSLVRVGGDRRRRSEARARETASVDR